MPIEVQWKIGPKKRGNWRTPFEFHQKFTGEELKLRPFLNFYRNYELPEKIYLGNKIEIEKRNSSRACKEITCIYLEIKTHIDEELTLSTKSSLSTNLCSYNCDDCRAYLPWRPGLPNYSDFEQVFRQVAEDLCEAWNQAVAEAMTSEEFENNLVIISSDKNNLFATKKEEEEKEGIIRPSRKLKI